MAEEHQLNLTEATIKVDGEEIGKDKFNKIRLIRVESVSDGPDACRVEIHSGGDDGGADDASNPLSKFKIGVELIIDLAGKDDEGSDLTQTVFKGLITGMGGFWGAEEAGAIVAEAFSHDHKLSRVRKTMTMESIKYSDWASSLPGEVGLSGDAESTSVTLEYMAMNNRTMLDYLQELARRVDYEIWSDGSTVNFKPHRLATASSVATLTYGGNLHRVKFRAQTAGLFTKVRVLSSRPKENVQLIGEATHGDIAKVIGGGKCGVELAKAEFGEGEYTISNYQAESQAEVDEVAKALMNQIARRFLTMEAEVEGTPTILAGNLVTVEGVPDEYNGDYYVQRAIHVYDIQGAGYRTHVVACSNGWGG